MRLSNWGLVEVTTTNLSLPRSLNWLSVDDSVSQDGVCRGRKGAILRWFNDSRPSSAAFNPPIADVFAKTRWLELKRIHKHNCDDTSVKKGEAGCDPAHKCDMTWNVIASNVNALSLSDCLDQCADETTFPFQGHGKAKTGLFGLIKGKPGVNRGAQIVLSCDIDRIRPGAHIHWHKLHHKHFSVAGNNKVCMLLQTLEEHVVVNGSKSTHKPLFQRSHTPRGTTASLGRHL